MEVVASLSQGRTAAAQCGLFTHKSVPVIFERPCTLDFSFHLTENKIHPNFKDHLVNAVQGINCCLL